MKCFHPENKVAKTQCAWRKSGYAGRSYGGAYLLRLVLDASAELGQNHEVDDERRCQQRVFADIGHGDGAHAAHHNLAAVLVDRALGVAGIRYVLLLE